jgi:CheY-like chemotaxis protein
MLAAIGEGYRADIVEGMADYLWFWAWQNMAVDTEMFEDGRRRPVKWEDVVPATPAVAAKPAEDLARLVEKTTGRGLDVLFATAWNLSSSSMSRARIAAAAKVFGRNIAADSLGVDDVMRGALVLPSFEISFDSDSGELAWDGTADDTSTKANPAVERILLIEDEPARQNDMVRVFRRIYPAAVVAISDNAIDAIAQIDSERFDLIVSDFDLADGTTGGDVLDYIHDKQPKLVNRFLFVAGNPIIQDLHSYWLMKGEVTKASLVAAIARLPVTNPSCCSGCA